MKGPFRDGIDDRFSDPVECEGAKFDVQFMISAFGCESILQFNVIPDIESLKVPYSFLCFREMADDVGTMNQAIDRALE